MLKCYYSHESSNAYKEMFAPSFSTILLQKELKIVRHKLQVDSVSRIGLSAHFFIYLSFIRKGRETRWNEESIPFSEQSEWKEAEVKCGKTARVHLFMSFANETFLAHEISALQNRHPIWELQRSLTIRDLCSIWKSGLVSWGRRRNSRNQNRAVTSEVSRVLRQKRARKRKALNSPIWQPFYTIVVKMHIWIWMLILAKILPMAAVCCPVQQRPKQDASWASRIPEIRLRPHCASHDEAMWGWTGRPFPDYSIPYIYGSCRIESTMRLDDCAVVGVPGRVTLQPSLRIVDVASASHYNTKCPSRIAHFSILMKLTPLLPNSLWFLRSGSSSNSLSCCLPCFPLSIGCFRLDHWHPHFYTINSQSQKAEAL